MQRRWDIAETVSDDIVTQLLHKRGVAKEDQQAFLHPDWDRDIHDPFLFTRMREAAERLLKAIRDQERIVIHGDYDADGISGASLLFEGIRSVVDLAGWEMPPLEVFLPDRERDGYGVAMHTVERFVQDGMNLMLTVDCGISNDKELARAHEGGVDVIVCDHHQLGEKLPEYAMLIHPLVPGETYPNKHLCGTGVAFKLLCGLFEIAREQGIEIPQGYEKWFIDLVAIATVTDVMPLLGENRVLEKYGLIVLQKTRRAGLKKIMEYAKVDMDAIDTTAIGFRIGPRINAAGRIASAITAFHAITAQTDEEADTFARELEVLNRERRSLSDAAFREAKHMVQQREEMAHVHVVWSDSWNPGIVGLIAGKLVSTFGIPAFAITKTAEHYVGSGRSANGLHLVEGMRSCGKIFLKAGGHPQACGLSLAGIQEIELFSQRIQVYAKEQQGAEIEPEPLEIDAAIRPEDIDWPLYEDLQKLQPFGQKNPEPVFCLERVSVRQIRTMGKDSKHLSFDIQRGSDKPIRAVGFGFGSWADELQEGDLLDIACTMQKNVWNGNRSIQVHIIDMKRAST